MADRACVGKQYTTLEPIRLTHEAWQVARMFTMRHSHVNDMIARETFCFRMACLLTLMLTIVIAFRAGFAANHLIVWRIVTGKRTLMATRETDFAFETAAAKRSFQKIIGLNAVQLIVRMIGTINRKS